METLDRPDAEAREWRARLRAEPGSGVKGRVPFMEVTLSISEHADVEVHDECTRTSFAARTKDGDTQCTNVQTPASMRSDRCPGMCFLPPEVGRLCFVVCFQLLLVC